MKTLEFIKKNGIDALEEFAIRINRNPDGRIILNYHQIDSPKTHEIVRECRALTVSTDGTLIARSFPRFFNYMEAPEITGEFIWEDCKAREKIDGCFTRDTGITMADGSITNIKDIGPGMKVMGISNGILCESTVLSIKNTRNSIRSQWLKVTLNDNSPYMRRNSFTITPNHSVFLNGVFQPVANAKVGDIMVQIVNSPSDSVLHYIKSSLLGDGCVTYNGPTDSATYKYQEGHIVRHHEYNKFVEHCLGDFVSNTRSRISGYGSDMVQVTSKSSKILSKLRKEWYPNRKRDLPVDLSWIDDFSIAKMYMDDGSLQHSNKQQDRGVINCNSLSVTSANRMANLISNRYGVHASVSISRGKYPFIRVNAGKNNEIDNFWQHISPHIISCMRYKLPERYRNIVYAPYQRGEYGFRQYKSTIKSIEELQLTNGRWDIQTTSQNYFACNTLVHNSLIKTFYWNGSWRVQTRNSFANSYMENAGTTYDFTWEELVWQILGQTDFAKYERKYRHLTFVMELCSEFNRVVRKYSVPVLYLLGAFAAEHEVQDDVVNNISNKLRIPRPLAYEFANINAVQLYLGELSKSDPTFEGFVLQDINGLRIKIKSAKYLAISRLFNNGNVCMVKNLVPLVLDGELGEIGVYFPEIVEKAESVQKEIDRAFLEVSILWDKYKGLTVKKDFALAVKDSKYAGVLFQAYSKGEPKDYWDAKFIIKHVF